MASGGPNLGNAYITIIPTTKNARKELSKTLVPEMEASGKEGGEAVSKGLGSVLSSGVGKIAGLAKSLVTSGAAQAIQAFQSDVIGAYSSFEQLSGGVEKIFDEMDTSRIFADAKNAYKDLGISANEYLEAMTSIGATFAATLGDEEGYNVARQGMKAVSDLASGTGKDLGQLTEKYQLITRSASSYLSIADQFAGILPQSTEGFLEQAKAAGLIDQSYQKITEIPLPEYQKAVTTMIEQGVGAMGLLGNTAAEAEQTLEGSTNMMKAAWQNLLVAFGAGSQEEISLALNNVLDSAVTWGGLMLSRLGIVANSILDALPGVWNAITSRVHTLFDQVSGIVQERLSKISEFADALGGVASEILAKAGEIVTNLVRVLIPKIGQLIERVITNSTAKILSVDWIGIGESILNEIMSIDWTGFVDGIFRALSMAFTQFGDFISAQSSRIGPLLSQIVGFIASSAKDLLVLLVGLAREIISSIVHMIIMVDWIDIGRSVLSAILSVDWGSLGVAILSAITASIKRIGDLAVYLLNEFSGLVVQMLPLLAGVATEILHKIPQFALTIAQTLISTILSVNWVGIGRAVLDAIMSVDWISLAASILSAVVGGIGDIVGSILEKVKSVDWLSLASSILSAVVGGIGDIVGRILEEVKLVDWVALGQDIINAIMSVDWLGIATSIVDTVSTTLGDIVGTVIGPDLFGGIKDAASQVAGPVQDALAPVSDKIKGIFGDTVSKVQEALPGIISWVTEFGTKVGEFFSNVPWDKVGEFLGFLVTKLAEIGGSIGSVLGDVLGGVIWPLIKELWGFLESVLIPGLLQFLGPLSEWLGIVADYWAKIYDWIAKLVSGVVDFLKPAIEILFAFLKPLIAGLISALADIFGTIVSTLGTIWDHVKPFVDKVVEIVSGIFSAIGGFLEENKGWIMAIVGWLGETLGSFFSILSGTIGGIFKFIGDLIGGVFDHVTKVIDGIGKVIGGFIDIVRGIFDVIVGVITGDFDKAKEGVDRIFSGFGQAVQGFADMITAPFKTAFNAIKDLWNNTLGGFEFTAPDWLPIVGGQTFGIPKLALGGTIETAGTVMVGEEGPELLTLPRGATVTPLDDSTAATGDTYIVEVGDVNLSDDAEVKRVTKEYLEYLASRASATSPQRA